MTRSIQDMVDDEEIIGNLQILMAHDILGSDSDDDEIEELRARVCEWLEADADRTNSMLEEQNRRMLNSESVYEGSRSMSNVAQFIHWIEDEMGYSFE